LDGAFKLLGFKETLYWGAKLGDFGLFGFFQAGSSPGLIKGFLKFVTLFETSFLEIKQNFNGENVLGVILKVGVNFPYEPIIPNKLGVLP